MNKLYFSLAMLFVLSAGLVAQSTPQIVKPLGTLSGYAADANVQLNLNDYFANPDETESITYEVLSNSFIMVASATVVNEHFLKINFLEAGQTNIWVKATSNGQSLIDKLIVGVQPKIVGDYVVTDFEDLTLENESYWNGSDGSGGFESGVAEFKNSFFDGFWSDWAYSNLSDNTTAGYTNQYSAITGAGFNPTQSEGSNYGVAYIISNWTTYEIIPLSLSFKDAAVHSVKGLYVTNSAYVALSMEEGDNPAKKFGGESGNDPDYLKLLIWGVKDGVNTEVVEFNLADYRFEDNSKDYIVRTWQWVELSSLGEVDNLFFSLESTDVGDYGMNTPSYFNIDNLYVVPNTPSSINKTSLANVAIYPNPSNGIFKIQTENTKPVNVRIYNMQGVLIYAENDYSNSHTINISTEVAGQYIIHLNQGENIITKSIIIK